MMDHNTSRGIAAVRRIKRQYQLDGVYGTLAELLEVSDKYRTAVEVTAGNSLFHVVVDNDETATKVLEILNKEKSGRVTFMPLNRLKAKNANIPQSNDSIPMINKIKYDAQYERAFQQVFGRTVICRDLHTAAQFARSHGLNAITPEGDRSDKRGALTGGFHDPRSSRLEAVRNVTKWREELDSKKARSTEIKQSLGRLDQEITKAVGEFQKLEQRRHQVQNSSGPLRQELKSKQDLLRNKKENLEAKLRAKQNIGMNVKSLTDQQNAHEAELATDFKKDLTVAEETELENLGISVQDLRKQYSELSSTRSDLEARKSVLEVELRENLHPRLDQLQSQDIDSPETGLQGNLKDCTRELKRLDKTLQDLSSRLQETEESIETATSQIQDLENRNADTRKQQEEIAKAIERHQRRMEKGMQKKAQLTKAAVEVAQNIQDLGVLPQEASTRFQKTESNAIVKRLHKVNEALKKYSHVNKKAFEQYNNFTKQREVLTTRREELDASQKSIDELIVVLDQRKDEAIERTFKQVSKEFATVFEKLVPAGRGRLIIQRKTDRAAQHDVDSDEEEARRESVENYTGVGISVSFNSKHDDQQRIQQLSGGQKSNLPSNPPSKPQLTEIIFRSLRPSPCLRNPSLRSGPILSLRRDRRKPRCPIPNSCLPDAARKVSEWAVHLYDVPTRDVACRREVLRSLF
jgi:structural maintenance of chromosome 3 (chondroitin sulfate proteoglycan 6)